MNIKEISKEIYDNNVAKGFWDEERNVGEMLMLVVSELSEALEAHRNGNFRYIKKITTTPDEFEEWRDIDGFDGEYEVSNLGRVRSLDLNVWNGVRYYTKNGRILKPGLGGNGYYTVSLRGNSHKVSRLVAGAFCDGYFENAIVNHINGNKKDDYSNNLEWVSYSENNNHALRTGAVDRRKILSKEEMIDIAFMCKSKTPHKEINLKYPQVTLSAIKNISRNRDQFTESVEFEISDAVIRLLDISQGLGIDLEWHIRAKLNYNKTRPHKHGKKY